MTRKIYKAYGLELPLVDVPHMPKEMSRSPTAADKEYAVGDVWIYKATADTATSYQFGGIDSSGNAIWILNGPGASDVDTLTGDGGGAISPAGGNITLAGGTNITSAGAGSTITFNLDATVALATSMSSPLYTAGAGVDLDITAPAGQDIVMKLGDAAGANKLSVTDNADVEVFAVDSNGAMTFAGLTIAGAFAQTGGTFNVGQDNAANAINIGGGTTARAIGIGNSAAAHTMTIGSVTGAASLALQCGTGNFDVDGVGGSTYTIGDSTVAGTVTIGGNAQTGAFALGPSTAAMTMNIANADGAKVINMGNGVDGNTIAIGNGINTSAQTINIASGAAAANSTVNIFGGIATAGTQTLNLATGASATAVNIGNATGATAIGITSGTGSIALASTGTGNITLDSDNTLLLDADGVLELNSSAGVIGIGNDADAQNINIGTGAAARVITMGNITGASQLVFNSGTAGIQMISTGAGDISLDSDDTLLLDADGVLELNSSGGVIGIGNDADAQDINIGTGAAARTITIGNGTGATAVTVDCGTGQANFGSNATVHTTIVGSSTGASRTDIQAGTGRMQLIGTVKEVTSEFMTRSGDYVTFTQSPLAQSNANTGAAPTGAGGDVNLLSFQEGMLMEHFMIGTQTIIAPRMDATGLLCSLDLTSTDGWEMNFGAARANSRHSFTIGTDAAFFMELRFTLADVSGCEPFIFGFRKTAANNATYTNYTDVAAIGVNDGVVAGNSVIQTNLNGAGFTNTNTTDAFADAATHTMQVLVSAAGVVTFTIDGGAPSVTQAFTFDNADVVHPFIHSIFNAAAPGNIHLQWLKVGYQA